LTGWLLAHVISYGLVTLMLFWFWSLLMATWALIWYWYEPCDQPMNLFMVLLFVADRIYNAIKPDTTHSTIWEVLRALFVSQLPVMCVIACGLYMVNVSETCHRTNPGLFYPTRRAILLCASVHGLFNTTLAIMYLIGRRRFIIYVCRLGQRLASQRLAGVAHLARIAQGSQELMETQDEVKSCPICIQPLSGGEEDPVVKTLCGHYFHEDCMAAWIMLQSPATCPLCRQHV
jgi:hypothetical protein